jgi:thymidylate synthase (FAD)
MNVELVHASPDAEKLIVKMARVSNPANQDNEATAPRLLRYLIKHQHWSPFEMASMCVKIETERDIAAQILRHRSFSFQEFSQRYATAAMPIIPALRRQDETNRQSSHDDLDPELQARLTSQVAQSIGKAYGIYEALLMHGVAKETARRMLPLCTPTTLYMHGTIRSWIHYLKVRCSHETQLEHRQVAEACQQIFMQQFPVIGAVFTCSPNAP